MMTGLVGARAFVSALMLAVAAINVQNAAGFSVPMAGHLLQHAHGRPLSRARLSPRMAAASPGSKDFFDLDEIDAAARAAGANNLTYLKIGG